MAGPFQEPGMVKPTKSADDVLRATRNELGLVIGPKESMAGNKIENSEVAIGKLDRLMGGFSAKPWLPLPRIMHPSIIS